MTATLAQHMAARADNALRQRLIAAAEQAHIQNAPAWVDANIGNLVSADLSGSSLADVYAYADSQINMPAIPMGPGEDPTYVTDALVRDAVDAVNAPPE